MRYVHAQCLNEWRVASANPRSFERCETCGFAYRTQRTALAEWLQDERVVLVATVVGLLLLVLAGAVLPFHPERQLYALIRWEPSISSLTAEWWGAMSNVATLLSAASSCLPSVGWSLASTPSIHGIGRDAPRTADLVDGARRFNR